MINILSRIYRKFYQIFFWYLYKSTFRSLSRSVRFVTPFRIDGSDGISVGDGAFFQRGIWLYCCGINGVKANLSVGKGCVFGYNNHITSVREVAIGDHVLTANNVYISDNLHGYEDITKPIIQQPVRFKRAVEIGAGAWIGENVSIIGASVGKNSVIGANSVVTRDIPDYCVAVGAPAVVIKQFHLQLQKWVNKSDPVISTCHSVEENN
jgi:acetyltransferase-like isoleucine patch superfamily enzyme